VSLRYQINSRIFLSSLLILILGGAVAIWQARQAVSKEIESSLNLANQLIALNFPQGSYSSVALNTWLPRFISLEKTRHLKIDLQQGTNEIIKFATPKNSLTDNQPPQWFIHLVSSNYSTISQQLTTTDAKTITLVIRADPLDEINEVWTETRAFFISLLLMMLLTFLSVNLVFKRSFKAISIIIDSLKAIECGDYTKKLPQFYTKEYDTIARAINHAIEVLNHTQKANRALTLHSLEIQEEERKRLAQELHDELGQSLTAIKVLAVSAKQQINNIDSIANTITEVCDHLIKVVRSMMRNLHPIMLAELGLKATLEDLLAHWATRHHQLTLILYCSDELDTIEQRVAIQLFRIVQEAITNMVRHANAQRGIIRLELKEKLLLLSISDDGQGCSLDNTQGFGLLSIKERVASLEGDLKIESTINQGFSINVSIPL
jgi:two-component system sensor histidine kinase UhpB